MNEEQKKALRNLKTARGQIDGIINMIENGRYCIDVSNQMAAPAALLKKAQLLILNQHLKNCVVRAVEAGDSEEKFDEIMKVLEKVMK